MDQHQNDLKEWGMLPEIERKCLDFDPLPAHFLSIDAFGSRVPASEGIAGDPYGLPCIASTGSE